MFYFNHLIKMEQNTFHFKYGSFHLNSFISERLYILLHELLKIMKKTIYILVLSLLMLSAKVNLSASTFIPANKFFSAFGVSDTLLTESKKFNLFVNQGTLYIKYHKPQELQNGEVIVYNLLGQEVTRKKLEVTQLNQLSIPVQNTCYLVRIAYSGKIYTQKIMVQGR